MALRRISPKAYGELARRHHQPSASTAHRVHHRILIGEYLGLEPICDGIWAVYFGWKRIGFLDESKMKIVDTYGKMAHKKV
jgi:hypothetical protein